jgi:NIPSNAP protein
MGLKEIVMSKCFWCCAAIIVAGAFTIGRLSAADQTPKNRYFEMRTYTANEGKLDALNARFRNHTNGLFEKHGMTIIGFWTPSEGPEAKDTLIYILAYPDKEARAKSWKAFVDDPEWKKAKAESEVNGSLVKANGVKSVFMNPTDYSPIK